MSMQQARWIIGSIAGVGLIGFALQHNPAHLGAPAQPVSGPIHTLAVAEGCRLAPYGCMAGSGARQVHVRIAGSLRPGRPFSLHVVPAASALPEIGQVVARFSEGGDRGFNQYTLARMADGSFSGRGILPRTFTDGGWNLRVSLLLRGQTWVADFPIESAPPPPGGAAAARSQRSST